MNKVETWQRGPEVQARQGILGDHVGGELSWSGTETTEPELTEEDLDGVKQRMQAVDKLFAEQGLAKYKIELMFGVSRPKDSRYGSIPGALQYFESGGKAHSGGDVKLYICPARTFKRQGLRECPTPIHVQHNLPVPKTSECEMPLIFSRNGFGLIYCGNCQQLWTAEQVVGEILCHLPMRKWAEVVYKHFRVLEMNADVVVKFAYDDLRAAALMEQARELRGDKLTPVRQNRPMGIYRLSSILKDVNAGADLLKRFYAFLTV